MLSQLGFGEVFVRARSVELWTIIGTYTLYTGSPGNLLTTRIPSVDMGGYTH